MKKCYVSKDVETDDEISKAKREIEELRMKLYKETAGRPFTDPVVLKINQEFNRMVVRYEQLLSKR